jgi:Spy/CpxP family protein refolding chaperone
MKRLKPWLLLLLVFCTGFAGGVVATRATVRDFVRHAVKDPNFMRGVIERRIAFRLRLDAEQRSKLHDILLQTQGDLKTLRLEFQPRFLTIIEHAQSEIEATLTPEQRKRFEDLKAENRPWWR